MDQAGVRGGSQPGRLAPFPFGAPWPERAFFPREREPFLALENLLWALLIEEASTLRGGTTEPSESVWRCVRPTSIPTGLEGSTCGISLSGWRTTTWISVRRGVRTTRSSFTLAPPPRALLQAVPLVSEPQAGKPLYSQPPPHRRCPLGTGWNHHSGRRVGYLDGPPPAGGLEPGNPGFCPFLHLL